MTDLFFELLRVSIGQANCLSHIPSQGEWKALYDMAKKQSLIGVCFVGLQRLGADANGDFAKIGMNEMLYLTWMGMAAKIQQRNDVVKLQCSELQQKFASMGIATRILKGQGTATLYKSVSLDLPRLRQSGDIDLWVIAPEENVIEIAEDVGCTKPAGYLHVGARYFEDTEVELHYRPTYIRSLRHNRRLQKFCDDQKTHYEIRDGLTVPAWDFDIVYQLSHIFRHLFGNGVGLRQLMDYYFLLKYNKMPQDISEHKRLLNRLGLEDFAGAVMFVMREVFHLEKVYMICPEDEKRGSMLLKRVLQTGNFGHNDIAQKKARKTTLGKMGYKLSQWFEMVSFYPEETLSAPFWTLWQYAEKRNKGKA